MNELNNFDDVENFDDFDEHKNSKKPISEQEDWKEMDDAQRYRDHRGS